MNGTAQRRGSRKAPRCWTPADRGLAEPSSRLSRPGQPLIATLDQLRPPEDQGRAQLQLIASAGDEPRAARGVGSLPVPPPARRTAASRGELGTRPVQYPQIGFMPWSFSSRSSPGCWWGTPRAPIRPGCRVWRNLCWPTLAALSGLACGPRMGQGPSGFSLCSAVSLRCALEFSRALYVGLGWLQVNASCADLSQIRISNPAVLTGVLWTDDTVWPKGLTKNVRTLSHELEPGLFEVRPHAARAQATPPREDQDALHQLTLSGQSRR